MKLVKIALASTFLLFASTGPVYAYEDDGVICSIWVKYENWLRGDGWTCTP
jgi:hypothetical protein